MGASQLWGLAGLLALLSSPAAWADECDSPLPDTIMIQPATPDVPEEYSKFLGRWSGEWEKVLCHNLIVEQVAADGSVRAIYSWGTYSGWNIHKGYTMTSGKIEDGKLTLRRFGNGAQATYWFSGPDLEATYVGNRGNPTPGRFSKIGP